MSRSAPPAIRLPRVVLALLLVCVARAAPAAEVVMKTESWANTDAEFAKCNPRIDARYPRNLLSRRGVRIATTGGLGSGALRYLTDGSAGTRGDQGRCFVSGTPSVITYYLGLPKTLKELGLYTGNIDARANQVFEVRFANNAAVPGKMPKFPAKPHLTSGDKVLGKDGGAFHTWFVEKSGGPLVPGKVDWVEFRLWQTYSVRAGQPAKTGKATGASVYIELEVLGPEDDLLPAAEIARRAAIRKAPQKPRYEKKATWQDTLVAAREAIVEWECMHDLLALPDAGIALGPWHVIGPVPARSQVAVELERARRLDPAKPVAVKGAQPVAWQRLDALKDGTLCDLAQLVKAKGKAGDVVFACRTLRVEQPFDRRNPLSLGLGLGDGEIRLLPPRRVFRAPEAGQLAGPNQLVADLSINPGQYQLLAKLPVAANGSCEFWFAAQPGTTLPGAGDRNVRIRRREQLVGPLRRDFPDAVSSEQIAWEQADSIWIPIHRRAMAGRDRLLRDWRHGDMSFLTARYQAAAESRLAALEAGLAAEPKAVRDAFAPWLARHKSGKPTASVAEARQRYYAVATAQAIAAEAHRIESMRLAVEDQRDTFGARHPKAPEYLARTAALQKQMDGLLARIGSDASALAGLLSLRDAVTTAGREILLANPVLDFQKLLLIRGGPGFSSNWGGMNRLGNELVVLSPVRPDGEIKTIHKAGGIGDSKLSFDGKRVLFSDGRRIQEINVDGTGLRHISPELEEHVYHYDPCYLPNGKIVFVSTACEQAVPCTGGWHVGNLHVMDADGRNERRLTYDQDHDWNPSVLNSGRVIYTRWEYTDTPHYFSRLLFHMNPDGTEQMEYYGSGSYWPNAMYWAKPIPGHPTKTVCVVSGHHGVARMGELIILDPARGRHEADGVVQRIPGRGRKVEPVIVDGLVMDEWPRFATPYPLAEPGTHRGAGKYFLAAVKMTPHSPWGLYLVDVFDNMTPLLMGGYSNPIPLRPRPRPPVIPSKVDLARKDAVVYMVDVYEGAGIKGFPRGTVKALRIGSHHYRYGGNGDTRAASYEGGWDVKTILGTVPVHADGSAYFRIPANTPIFLQPLDAEGKAQQTMRSWFVGMPGEVVSCVGCHEQQNSVPPNSLPLAALRDPAAITPWHGPARGFSFDREVQPVLDRRCAGCHDGQPRKDGRQLPDFRAKRRHKDFKGNYSPAYMALHPFVRRAGYEADYHMPAPAEWGAETGVLVQMLKKGHHNVRLTAEEWGRLYAWIDFNVPYAANWGESHRPPDPEQVARRVKYKKLLANIDDRDEEPLPLPPVAKFEAPAPESARPAPAKLDGWPLAAEQAQAAQKDAGSPRELVLKLSGDVTMNCALIPAGRFVMGDVAGFPDEYPEAVVAIGRPFYLGQFEVTNDQYALYDSKHDSAYMDARGKDRFTRGYPVNEPKQPVIRVSWHQAMAFCKWLSRRSGHDCTLPTEAEWEHACRAGTATPWAFGSGKSRPNNAANFSDGSLSSWNWGRVEPNYHDGARFSIPGGRYKPNAWGLHDMHGNVAEWTRSVYRPYPYSAATEDGAPARGGLRVVRGGSWNDTLRFGRSASRWRYPAHQPVYNVGFRVLVRPSRVVRR